MTLLEALDDPAVFAPHFPSPAWDRWRTFARALYALPMTTEEQDFYQAHTGRLSAPTRPARECYVACGRRGGKSRFAALIATYIAALAPTDMLAPGEIGVVLVTAVTREQAGVVLSYIKALFAIPALRALVVDETAESITLAHNVRVEVRSSNFRTVRGVTLLAAVCDEIAFLRDESSANPDVELVRALRPALSTTKGLLLAISSPWAQKGVLWRAYKKHWGKDGDTLVWQAATRDMHPDLDIATVDDALEDDPEAAQSEWGGSFRADLESFISQAAVDAVTTPNVVERPPVAGIAYAGFLDAAAGSGRDSFTAAVTHSETGADGVTRIVLDAVREIRPKFDPMAVAEELAAFLKTYSLGVVQSDAYAGAWVVTAFAAHGVHVEQDALPKSQLYLAALPILTSGRADLLDLARLRSQLVGLERRRRSGGRDVVDHSPGAHDDVANAVAGALVRADVGMTCEVGFSRGPALDWSRAGVDGVPRAPIGYLDGLSRTRWRDVF
jgi:hypothetical protein